MSQPLSIQFARMDALSDHLAKATEAISSDLRQLDSQARKLQGEWSGEAQEAYAQAHATWSAALADMTRILSQANTAVASINDRHRTAAKAVSALWGQS